MVLGGGLAGVLAAQTAASMGRAVTVLDDGHRRASDAPCALVHPFVGGSFRPRANVAEAWAASVAWFSRFEAHVRRSVVRRHIPWTDAGARLLRSWPHVEALAHTLFPHVVAPTAARAVEYGPVFAVDLQALLIDARADLERAGVTLQTGRALELERTRARWRIQLEGGASVDAATVVVAAGAGARTLLRPHGDVEPLGVAEGSLAWAPGTMPGPFLIHGGHASAAPTRRAWGATYRMLEGDARDPTEAMRALDARLRAVGADLPPLSQARVWTASRLVDRRTRTPWVRALGPNLIAFCGFGSQGCLWGPWSATRLADVLATAS
ncbi:MAG: FAD-dependent oxidoreductase [Myxococcota bacterium]